MEIDIRKETAEEITSIRFADKYGKDGCTRIASYAERGPDFKVKIRDGGEYVYVESVEHAEDLINTLRKAIDLGWLK